MITTQNALETIKKRGNMSGQNESILTEEDIKI